MTKTNMNRFFTAVFAALCVFTGTASADNINLNMEGNTATIPKGNTITRRIFGVPNGIPGTLKIKLKWHAVNLIPNTFNALKVEIKHGDTLLKSDTCYSIHSDKPAADKCDFSIAVSNNEADNGGNWTMTVTNNSKDEVISFDIFKAGDPLVPNFSSVYDPNCPDTATLNMEGTTLTLGKGNTQERKIYGFGAANGDVVLKFKWHAVSIIPNTFNALKVEIWNGNDRVDSETCYSTHSNKTPKCDFRFNTGSRPNNAWKLKITNNSNDDVIGFNIRKEGDINPAVPNFSSTYKAKCQ